MPDQPVKFRSISKKQLFQLIAEKTSDAIRNQNRKANSNKKDDFKSGILTMSKEIRRSVKALCKDGTINSKEELLKLCQRVDELQEEYVSPNAFRRRKMTYNIARVNSLIQEARRFISENYELPDIATSITIEEEEDDSTTLDQEFEENGLQKSDALNVFMHRINYLLQFFAQISFLEELRNGSFKLGVKISTDEFEELNILLHDFTKAMEADLKSALNDPKTNFKIIQKVILKFLKRYNPKVSRLPISVREVFKDKIINEMSSWLERDENLASFLGNAEEIPNPYISEEDIWKVLNPEKYTACGSDLPYPYTSEEKDYLMQLLTGDWNLEYEKLEELAEEINDTFHGGLKIRDNLDILGIIEEKRDKLEKKLLIDSGREIEYEGEEEPMVELEEEPTEKPMIELVEEPKEELKEEPMAERSEVQALGDVINDTLKTTFDAVQQLFGNGDQLKAMAALKLFSISLIEEARVQYELRNPSIEELVSFIRDLRSLLDSVTLEKNRFFELLTAFSSVNISNIILKSISMLRLQSQDIEEVRKNLSLLLEALEIVEIKKTRLDPLRDKFQEITGRFSILRKSRKTAEIYFTETIYKETKSADPKDIFMSENAYLFEKDEKCDLYIREIEKLILQFENIFNKIFDDYKENLGRQKEEKLREALDGCNTILEKSDPQPEVLPEQKSPSILDLDKVDRMELALLIRALSVVTAWSKREDTWGLGQDRILELLTNKDIFPDGPEFDPELLTTVLESNSEVAKNSEFEDKTFSLAPKFLRETTKAFFIKWINRSNKKAFYMPSGTAFDKVAEYSGDYQLSDEQIKMIQQIKKQHSKSSKKNRKPSRRH